MLVKRAGRVDSLCGRLGCLARVDYREGHVDHGSRRGPRRISVEHRQHRLAERFRVTTQVGAHKAVVGLPPADPDREAQQVQRMRELAEAAGLDPVFSEKFLRFVIDEVIRHHEQAVNGD